MTEAVLVVVVIALVAFAVLLLGTVIGTALRVTAAYFFAPLPSPPSLERLDALVSRESAERRAAAIAGLDAEPHPPDALVALRSLTAPLGKPPSLPRLVALLERETDATARRPQPPVPEILVALRAFTGSGRRARNGREDHALFESPSAVRYAGARTASGSGGTGG